MGQLDAEQRFLKRRAEAERLRFARELLEDYPMATRTTTREKSAADRSPHENGNLRQDEKEFEENFLRDTFIPRVIISCVWVGAILYSTYQLFIFAEANLKWQRDPIMNPGPMTQIINRGRDTTDYEWYHFTESFFTSIIFWCLSYVPLNRTFQQFIPEHAATFSAIFCYCCLARVVGLWPASFMVIQPVVIWILLRLNSKVVIWGATFAYLYFLSSRYSRIVVPTEYGAPQYYFPVTVAWNAARCISFSMDTWGREGRTNLSYLASFLKYVFYFPVIMSGPLVLYEQYEKDMLLNPRQPKTWEATVEDVKVLGLKLMRLAIWIVVIELLLHYLYFRPLALTPVLLKEMNWWALCGVVYWLGQFFQAKYVVMYGITTAMAEFEGLQMPPLPKCIAYIHRYSVLWKDFDRGLYNFLVRYTYVPTLKFLEQVDTGNRISKELRKLMASFSSFVYVYVWHSTSYPVFVWAAFNFLGITLERIGTFVKRRVDTKHRLPPVVWDVVFEPFVTIPLAVMSVMNSVVFTGEMYTAKVLFDRFFSELSDHYVLHFMFCFTHTGVLVRSWPRVYAAFRGHPHSN